MVVVVVVALAVVVDAAVVGIVFVVMVEVAMLGVVAMCLWPYLCGCDVCCGNTNNSHTINTTTEQDEQIKNKNDCNQPKRIEQITRQGAWAESVDKSATRYFGFDTI